MMINNWKKRSAVVVLSGISLLIACNASEDPTADKTKEQSQILNDTGRPVSMIAEQPEKVIQIAAVDQPIPEAKKEVEGLPEATGLEEGESRTAPEIAADTSVKLKNPFTGDAEKIEQGKKKWFSFGCSGCHGGGGGGGMCPSTINEKWVYGGKDDVLFRLITLGSDALMAQGHTRIAKESVVGPMPQVGQMTNMTTEDIWLVMTYMRSQFKGRPEKIEW